MSKLDKLISRYGNLKSDMDSYKKQIDSDNKSIKDIMSTEGITEHTAGGYTAKYTIAVQESFDEDKLIERLHTIWKELHGDTIPCPWIKTVETPDMDAIENSLFLGELNGVEIADCKITKEVEKLTIKKEIKKENK